MAIRQNFQESDGGGNYVWRELVGDITKSLFTFPFTINLWAKKTTTNGTKVLSVHHLSSGGTVACNAFIIEDNAGTPLRMRLRALTSSGNTTLTNTNVSISQNTWYMVTAVVASATSRILYVNAVASATSTVSRTPLTIQELAIGAYPSNDPNFGSTLPEIYTIADLPFGISAELGIWNAALTADEITSLFKGARTIQVRPQSLRLYSPLIRNSSNDLVGKYTSDDPPLHQAPTFNDGDYAFVSESSVPRVVDDPLVEVHDIRRYG